MLHSLVALEWWLDWVEVLCRCLVWLVIVEPPQGSPPPILDFGGRPRLGRVATVISVPWFQSVYGHFVLPASDVEEKVLGMPRNDRKRAVIRWLQWRLVCVTTNKNKTSLLEGLLACMCCVYHGQMWVLVKELATLQSWCRKLKCGGSGELLGTMKLHNELSWQGEGGTIDQFSRRWTDVLFKCGMQSQQNPWKFLHPSGCCKPCCKWGFEVVVESFNQTIGLQVVSCGVATLKAKTPGKLMPQFVP